MAYRPLDELKETWKGFTSKLNDIFDYLHGYADNMSNRVKKSITTDDDKAQLVNDLTDAEITPNLVYGTDNDGTRGYKADKGGYVGTKQVDETDIGDNKVLTYDDTLGKYVLQDAAEGVGDVVGPPSNTDNHIPQWDGADSKTLKNGLNPATLATLTGVQTVTNKTVGSGTKVNTGEYDIGNSGDSKEIDFADGLNQRMTLTDNCTITFTGGLAGSKYLLKLIQDGAGNRTPTFPGTVKWAGGELPTWSDADGEIDIITLYFDGTDFFAVGNTDFKVPS